MFGDVMPQREQLRFQRLYVELSDVYLAGSGARSPEPSTPSSTPPAPRSPPSASALAARHGHRWDRTSHGRGAHDLCGVNSRSAGSSRPGGGGMSAQLIIS